MKKILSFLIFILSAASLFPLPSVRTGNQQIDTLTKKAQDEVILNITKDGVFSAGANWPTAWTRDMSYAIDLSLSFLFPETVEKSLASRIENGLILQDTGSGGSWPVSTDRIVWGIAAYDYAVYKNDFSYFQFVYETLKNTIEQDFHVNFDEERNLFRGETSFIDWREQSYPRWMENQFISESFALGTNCVYLTAIKRLEKLSEITGKSVEETFLWKEKAENLKNAINENFWNEKRKYFSNYIIRDIYDYRYDGFENLGNSLAILNEVNDICLSGDEKVIESGSYGLSVLAPQLGNVPPYHNDAVWPFVQGYYGLSRKKLSDGLAAEKEFKSMIEAAEKFGTFKENYEASSMSEETRTNSDRQLWSDAGFLSYIYRILFGISFTENGLELTPFVFMDFSSPIELKNLDFESSKVNIVIHGKGDLVQSILCNGKKIQNQILKPSSEKILNVEIQMMESETFKASYSEKKFTECAYKATEITPQIPLVNADKEGNTYYLNWRQKNPEFVLLKNFNEEKKISGNETTLKSGKFMTLYSVLAPSSNPYVPCLPGTPVRIESIKNTWLIEAEKASVKGGKINSESADEGTKAKLSSDLEKSIANDGAFIEKWGSEEGDEISFIFNAKEAGSYAVDFRFQNGHGPVNTGEKCAIRSLYTNGNRKRAVVLPQQGSWSSWAFTAPVVLKLKKGKNEISIKADEYSYSQRKRLNYVNVDLMRISRVE